ncbi:hypothetical protein BJ170DRAFT_195005 [Xylariales sp. AK1849]|nr:hypothetical protein BJ170DRAFT_195005 [Xylariales sp. AK1849]
MWVVNMGDIIRRITAELYKSYVHRILCTSGKHRYAVPMVLDGNLDFVTKPVVSSPSPSIDQLAVEERIIKMFRNSKRQNKDWCHYRSLVGMESAGYGGIKCTC